MERAICAPGRLEEGRCHDPAPSPSRRIRALAVRPPVPAPAVADNWQGVVHALETTARHCVQKRRDGDNAARHTEIRRRMRALARAARKLAGPAAG
jgi:hypothetical protein